ncbi:MFS transporter [Brachybacterium saurashtrense]|uniref:MFS transporter n=1 Tax=Brachybacterium saurashtrense TaxID=556288 RepID=A0A345YSW1_9MICO|nr:MFS transporter [Brachybacterium saurashtrense]RRR22728.1 MFS transporter [Brachybacterium saurashtrense]
MDDLSPRGRHRPARPLPRRRLHGHRLDRRPAGGPGLGVALVDSDARRPDALAEDGPSGKGNGRAMAAMGFSQAVDNSEGGLIDTFFPLIGAAFGVGEGMLGLLSAISKFARMLFGPFWAMMADKYGRKKILLLVTGVWGLWTIASGFAPNFTWLLILYSISVVGTVASEPIINGLLPDLFRQSQRGKAYGTIRAVGTGVGIVMGPAIGLFARGDDPSPDAWRYAMWTMGAISILSGVLIAMWVKDPRQNTAREDMMAEAGRFKISDGATLFKIPTVSLMAGMVVLVTSLVLLAFYPNFLVVERGLSVFQATMAMSFFSLGAVFSSFLGGRLADLFVRSFGEKGRIMLMQIYLVSFAGTVALVTQLPYEGFVVSIPLNLLLGLVFSVGFSGCVPPMVSNVVPSQLSATAFAMLFSLIQGGITALMVLGLGFVAEAFSSQTTFVWFAVVPYLLNAVYWTMFYRVYPRDVARQKERTSWWPPGGSERPLPDALFPPSSPAPRPSGPSHPGARGPSAVQRAPCLARPAHGAGGVSRSGAASVSSCSAIASRKQMAAVRAEGGTSWAISSILSCIPRSRSRTWAWACSVATTIRERPSWGCGARARWPEAVSRSSSFEVEAPEISRCRASCSGVTGDSASSCAITKRSASRSVVFMSMPALIRRRIS